MDAEEFRKWGHRMVNYVADYWITLRQRKPSSGVQPGYMRSLLPDEAPEQPESWESIFADLERVIMPGITHWHHPHFFAYFPTANCYASILGDILSAGIGSIGFTWVASPAYTELEMIMMDWLAKALDLPKKFLYSHNGHGAGMIQGTASECVHLTMLAAKKRALNSNPKYHEGQLVAYASDQAHSSVFRAALLANVASRSVPSDILHRMTGSALLEAIHADMEAGRIPFFVCVTLGTTPSCSFDCTAEIGPICQRYNIWLHIDAAYAGAAAICPEHRWILDGVEYADSYNFNPHKAMMINFDCSALWMNDTREIENSFFVDATYLKYDQQGSVPDFRNWQVPLGRRFRSLKVWFTLRALGVQGIRNNIRNMCKLAQKFARLVATDSRFEIVTPVHLGLVCFRLKDSNETNKKLLKLINEIGHIHVTAAQLKEVYIIRFSISSTLSDEADIEFAWEKIRQAAELVGASSDVCNS